MNMTGNWHFPTSVRFGPGRLKEISDVCREQNLRHPLFVTDAAVARLSWFQDMLDRCSQAGLKTAVYDGVQANPVQQNVDAGVAQYKSGNHDGVVAVGGGSGLDGGKAIALMVGQARPIWDFEDREDWWSRADPAGIAPIIAIPSTAGTGSEVGRAAVITDIRDHTKKIIFHPKMMPQIVIADPQVTVDLPAQVTAATGMDALSHNLEAFCSPVFHPLAQGIAIEGIRLIKQWLPRVFADGSDLEGRANMLVASSMGATAFQKGLGAMHSLSHPCGSVLGTHHGLTNAVVMPYVLHFNRSAIEERIVALARYLDIPNPSFDRFMDWVITLRHELQIPHTLSDLGVCDAHIPQFASMALLDPSTATNPRPMSEASFSALYQDAVHGQFAAS